MKEIIEQDVAETEELNEEEMDKVSGGKANWELHENPGRIYDRCYK